MWFFASRLTLDAALQAGIGFSAGLRDRLVAIDANVRRVGYGFAVETSAPALIGELVAEHFRFSCRRAVEKVTHRARTGRRPAQTRTRPLESVTVHRRV